MLLVSVGKGTWLCVVMLVLLVAFDRHGSGFGPSRFCGGSCGAQNLVGNNLPCSFRRRRRRGAGCLGGPLAVRRIGRPRLELWPPPGTSPGMLHGAGTIDQPERRAAVRQAAGIQPYLAGGVALLRTESREQKAEEQVTAASGR